MLASYFCFFFCVLIFANKITCAAKMNVLNTAHDHQLAHANQNTGYAGKMSNRETHSIVSAKMPLAAD